MENRLEIVKKLGEGSYGVAYLTRNKKNGKLYVLKKPLRGGNLMREYIALKTVLKKCKPYLVCLANVSVKVVMVQGKPVTTLDGIYTEYIPGTYDLYEYITKNYQDITFPMKFAIMFQLIKGLTVLHSLDVVHRDIKIENILINPKELMIHYIDFGFACLKTDIPCITGTQGSEGYMSPELVRWSNIQKKDRLYDSWDISIKADVWALGITFVYICYYPLIHSFLKRRNPVTNTYDAIDPTTLSDNSIQYMIKKDVVDTPHNQFFNSIIFLMLKVNRESRPTAFQLLKLMDTFYIKEFKKLALPIRITRPESRVLFKPKSREEDIHTGIYPRKQKSL